VTGSVSLQGLAKTSNAAHDQVFDGDQQSYSAGLIFEYPLGNRDAKAGLRRARLERTKAIMTLRNLAIQVGEQVKERVREVDTTYQELQAQRAVVTAAQAQLKALEDTEEIYAQLSPEFLNTKLSAQEDVANAERSTLEALVSYNTALITLSQVTGTVFGQYGVEVVRRGIADRGQ